MLGGWDDETGVWVFWDAIRHIDFGTKRSNSLQVTAAKLEDAHNVGIATQVRPSALGAEVVVAVTQDSLLWYVQDGFGLHGSDVDAAGVNFLVEASQDDERQFLDESADEIQAGRRYDVVELMRAYRDARFRPAVLRAYRYQCAVCGFALKLVDAAHIVPVSFPQSTDDLTNGLALCRLHHGAYDNGLLGIRSDYRVITNPDREALLASIDLDGGLDAFKATLPKQITVPAQRETQPDPAKLKLGLEARRWPRNLVR